jgi:hypothetical protein
MKVSRLHGKIAEQVRVVEQLTRDHMNHPVLNL